MRAGVGALMALAVAFTPVVAHAEEPPETPPTEIELLLNPVTKDRLFRTSDVGLEVVDTRTGEVVFSKGADIELTPASTMKVLTAATALRSLGASYRFSTELFTDGEIDASGVLRGNLYVKGHGDPTLVIEKLWKLVYDLKIEGVQKIAGDVVFDESFFDQDYRLPGWNKKADIDRGPAYFATLSALSLNFNTVALVVAPGPEVDGEARVVLETPASAYVEVVNEVVTVAEGGRRWLQIDRELENGKLRFTLEGAIPADGDVRRYYRSVPDPTAHFMAAWRELESVHGIKVTGKHRRGVTPRRAEMLLHLRSPPLSAVLMDMNKYSNNFMAEQVLRTVGAEVGGMPGTTEKGLAVVRAYLTDLGVGGSGYKVLNGSGLARTGLLRPSQLTAVLVDMAQDPKVGHEFWASLSIAGQDGTLWRRLTDEPGRMRGKTGTIDGVHCLAGYVEAADGGQYAFAFLVNEIRGGSSQVKRVHDRFIRRIFEVGSGEPQASIDAANP
jgi:D-alanyl-D-alanine carboxypeptidase/D-alanyl-D-alanine-endopeptidase (penicillin-binding protein 4)